MSTDRTQQEGLALPQIVVYGLLFALITVDLILLLQIGFFAMHDAEVERKAVVSDVPAQVEAEQTARLEEGVRWVDRDAGRVGMPIEKAMAVVVKRENPDAEAATP